MSKRRKKSKSQQTKPSNKLPTPNKIPVPKQPEAPKQLNKIEPSDAKSSETIASSTSSTQSATVAVPTSLKALPSATLFYLSVILLAGWNLLLFWLCFFR